MDKEIALLYSGNMSALEKVKAVVAELNPEEQLEFFRWWVESDAFKARQLAWLKREIQIGIEDLERGRCKSYDESNLMELAEEVAKRGRHRLTEQSQPR